MFEGLLSEWILSLEWILSKYIFKSYFIMPVLACNPDNNIICYSFNFSCFISEVLED